MQSIYAYSDVDKSFLLAQSAWKTRRRVGISITKENDRSRVIGHFLGGRYRMAVTPLPISAQSTLGVCFATRRCV